MNPDEFRTQCVLNSAGGVPPMEGNMVFMMIGSIAGHMIFGIVVALVVKEVA